MRRVFLEMVCCNRERPLLLLDPFGELHCRADAQDVVVTATGDAADVEVEVDIDGGGRTSASNVHSLGTLARHFEGVLPSKLARVELNG